MEHGKLNSLAVRCKEGCEESWMQIVGHFIPMIHRLSDANWFRLDSQERFEKGCIQRIREAVRKYDPERGNFAWQATFRLRNLLYQNIKRSRTAGRFIYFDDVISNTDSQEKDVVYEVVDDLAIVDDSYLVNEKIALLAEGDHRKMAILNAWINGYFNDSDTASFLAERFGGNSESHRKFIQRFRIRCQTLLARAV